MNVNDLILGTKPNILFWGFISKLLNTQTLFHVCSSLSNRRSTLLPTLTDN